MVEKKTEDIIDRLEALRKRVPEEKKPAVAQPPPTEGRARRARMVGIIVVLLVVFGGLGVIYKLFWQPKVTETIERVQEEQARLEQERLRREEEKQALLEAKNQKITQISEVFEGLPVAYTTAKSDLRTKVDAAKDIGGVNAIDVEAPANEAWRSYRLAEMNSLLTTLKEIELRVDGDVFRAVPEIKLRIQSLSFGRLRNATLRELKYEYVPMRVTRERSYFPEENTTINIHFKKNENETIYLAKDAKLVSFLRAKSSGSIAMSESETRSRVGGGVEGVGTVTAQTIGGATATLAGTFTGSAGTAMSQSQTTFAIDLSEVQKAYAAKKISETDFKAMLDKYGLRLDEIEESTSFGDFGVEYLLLVKVTADEAPGLVLKLFTPEDRGNILITRSPSK